MFCGRAGRKQHDMTGTKRRRQVEPIPEFKSYEEEADWWNTHDLTDYWDQFEPVKVKFNLKPMESITFSLDAHNTKRLWDAAKRRGFPWKRSSRSGSWNDSNTRTGHETSSRPDDRAAPIARPGSR